MFLKENLIEYMLNIFQIHIEYIFYGMKLLLTTRTCFTLYKHFLKYNEHIFLNMSCIFFEWYEYFFTLYKYFLKHMNIFLCNVFYYD